MLLVSLFLLLLGMVSDDGGSRRKCTSGLLPCTLFGDLYYCWQRCNIAQTFFLVVRMVTLHVLGFPCYLRGGVLMASYSTYSVFIPPGDPEILALSGCFCFRMTVWISVSWMSAACAAVLLFLASCSFTFLQSASPVFLALTLSLLAVCSSPFQLRGPAVLKYFSTYGDV